MDASHTYHAFGHLLDEVEVPDDGTLSRVLFNGDGMRVVLFAFDTGQELTDHTAAMPAVVFWLPDRERPKTLLPETTLVLT